MLSAILTLSGIGLIAGIGLGIAYKKFAVKTDPLVERVCACLPGANCGGCGFSGCIGLAEAIVNGKAGGNACVAGGEEVSKAIAAIMGVEAIIGPKKVAKIMCKGGKKEGVVHKFEYAGISNCRAASLIAGGWKGCNYGCLGLGSCVEVCPFGALKMGDNNLPIVDENICTGCGKCVVICPKQVIVLVPVTAKTIVYCNSKDKGTKVKTICRAGCLGCGLCRKVCPNDAIILENNLARVDYDKCISCEQCIEKCPTKIIGHIS
ncbi:MAG: RnfABCDGE type electron transport complex subunit B [bacterium]